MSQRLARPALLAVIAFTLILAGLTAAAIVSARDDTGSVSVVTDALSYAPGDPITVTVVNGSTTPIAPQGGIVCQGIPRPFGVQQLDDAGNWQDLAFPRTPPCIGVAVAPLGPGENQTRTFAAATEIGTYRVVYAYTPTDGSAQALAVSNPYDVANPPAQAPPMGYFEGQVTIGPLQPVERVGVPPATPSPAVCTARGLVVYQADTGAEAARFPLGPDCHYRVALPEGDYRVELDRRGIDFSKDLPRGDDEWGPDDATGPQHRHRNPLRPKGIADAVEQSAQPLSRTAAAVPKRWSARSAAHERRDSGLQRAAQPDELLLFLL